MPAATAAFVNPIRSINAAGVARVIVENAARCDALGNTTRRRTALPRVWQSLPHHSEVLCQPWRAERSAVDITQPSSTVPTGRRMQRRGVSIRRHDAPIRISRRMPQHEHERQGPKCKRPGNSGPLRLVGGLGFEPRLTESESVVLPLDDPPIPAAPSPICPGGDPIPRDQRFENCVPRRALRNPTFLRSTSRASRVT
jgi:hypothetical protein